MELVNSNTSSSMEETIERQPMIGESHNMMDSKKKSYSPILPNESNIQHLNHYDIGMNEKMYKESYQTIVHRIVSSGGDNDNDDNEDDPKLKSPTSVLLDDRISHLYTQLEEEGVNDLISRLENNERRGIGCSYDNDHHHDDDNDERIVNDGCEERLEMNDEDNHVNAVNEHDFSSDMAYNDKFKDGDKQPNTDTNTNTKESMRECEEGGENYDHHDDMSEIIEFDSNDHNQDVISNTNNHKHDKTTTTTRSFELDHNQNRNNYVNEYNNHDENDDSSSTVSSIELARKSKRVNNTQQRQQLLLSSNNIPTMFQSPTNNSTTSKLQKSYKKRVATTSGKKGTDIQRLKTINRYSSLGIEDDVLDHADGFQFTRDYDHCTGRVDGIMNATAHYNPMDHSPLLNDDDNRMSFLDSALNSQSPIPRRKSLDDSSFGVQSMNGSIGSIIPSSPKHPHHRNSKYHSPSRQEDISGLNDSIESVDSNFMQKDENSITKSDRNIDEIDSEDDKIDVTLRQDYNFYLDPLEVYRPSRQAASSRHHSKQRNTKSTKGKHNKKTEGTNKTHPHRNKNIVQEVKAIPTCTYVEDPFREFGSRTAGRLDVVLEWLLDHDISVESSQIMSNNNSIDDSCTVSRAVVISRIPFKQIMSLVLCTMVKNGVHQTPRQSRPLQPSRNRSCNISGDHHIYGGTLIVARSKEDVANWLCSLREKTSFSVLNHCEISSSERRRVTILSKCTGYDIVLTTHDALKAKEATATVDGCGRVIRQTNSQGAWLSSKSSNSQNESQHSCKVLCRLHSIEWTRVIFIDILGRTSYLTKPGTARMEAAAALKAKSRYVYMDLSLSIKQV